MSTESDRGSLVTFARNPATGLLQYLGVDRRSLTMGSLSGSITGVTNNSGKARIATNAGAATNLKRGDLVELTNAGGYTGLQKVDAAISSSAFTIEAAFAGNQTTGTWTLKRSEMRGALGVVVSPDGKYVYTANYGIPAVQDGGNVSEAGNEGSLAAFGIAGPRVSAVKLKSTTSGVEHGIAATAGTGVQLATVPLAKPQQLRIVFDRDLLTSSIAAADLTLTELNGAATPSATFSYDPPSRTATWSFASPLPKGQWKVVLNADGTSPITDVLGQPLDGEWTNPTTRSGTGQTSSGFSSGNGAWGGNFEFYFTLLRSAGDANLDNLVGSADYTIWAAQFGTSGTELSADFDGNGTVGSGDYALWAANFGLDYTSWPLGLLRMSGGGDDKTSNAGPQAALATVLELYASGKLDWQFDAEQILGWNGSGEKAERTLSDFLFEFEAWHVSLSE